MKDQLHLNFKVERLQSSKGKARVYWRMIQEPLDSSNAFGSVEFEEGEIHKTIDVSLDFTTLDLPTRIELFNPSNGYRLGENEVSSINFVGKFLVKLITNQESGMIPLVSFQLVVL